MGQVVSVCVCVGVTGLRGRWHGWLRALVGLLGGCQGEGVRLPLLAALLRYLLLCSAGSLAALPSPVLQALLEGTI